MKFSEVRKDSCFLYDGINHYVDNDGKVWDMDNERIATLACGTEKVTYNEVWIHPDEDVTVVPQLVVSKN